MSMWYTAFLLGLAGSLHCVGMCGPLMLAMPLPADARRAALAQTLVYQSGRILTYVALGGFFGVLGQGIAIAGFQQALSIVAGVAMITAALFSTQWERTVLQVPGLAQLTRQVQRQMGRLLRTHAHGTPFVIGLLNGLVPCGLVYAAVAGAISTTNGLHGAVFMMLFGLGTLPLLLVLMWSGQRIPVAIRSRFRYVQPALLLIAAALLLYRGFHLDLSLFYGAVPPAIPDCHQ
jgi:sulfite exporter TauE/SafE